MTSAIAKTANPSVDINVENSQVLSQALNERPLKKWSLQIAGMALALSGLAACAQPSGPVALKSNDGQIIGGTDATGEESFSKTVVSLYNVKVGSLCTASIYSEDMLITAAHCLDGPAEHMVVFFEKELKNDENLEAREVVAYEVSPLWEKRMNQMYDTGDIAVVKFAGGLPEGFRPAEVLKDDRLLKNGGTTLLAGYGLSDGVKKTGSGRLRYVETKIQDIDYSYTEVLIDQSQGKGACHGDSGGPAYIEVNGELYLWGVTSRGVNDRNNDCSVSAAYTNIPAYAQFIELAVKKLESIPTEEDVPSASGF